MIVAGKNINNGDLITFDTYNANDTTRLQGYVEAVDVSYSIATHYSDVPKYHQEVIENEPSVPEDFTTLKYFIIRLDTDLEQSFLGIAVDWVEQLDIVTVNQDINITVFNVDETGIRDVLAILRSNGYRANIATIQP